MEKVEFFTLARPIQERFVESSRGSSAPAPIAVKKPPLDLAPVLWGAGSAALLLACAALTKLGYGNLDSSVAIAPLRDAIIYSALLAGSTFCAFRAARLLHRPLSLPYRTGIYLFPIGVVDARGATLKVHKFDLETNIVVAQDRPLLCVTFPDGTSFEFPATDHATAEYARNAIAETQQRISTSDLSHKQRDLALLDPLCDNGFKNPFAPAEPMREPRPSWARYYVPIALVVGAVVGMAAWQARNTFSEARLYAVARSIDSSEAYQKYLDRGGARPEVSDTLLPRAQLREAQSAKSVASIEAFIGKHPSSKIENEIQAALTQALERELSEVRAKHSLTALREFESRYGKYAFTKPAVDKAISALVRATLAQYQKEFGSGTESAQRLFAQLLAFTAEKGPTVEIRFRRKLSDSIERAEKALKKSTYYAGESTLPAQFFEHADFEPREAEAAQLVIEQLKRAFPSDMLDPKLGSVLEDEAELPAVKVPTLIISHKTEMSGTFLSKKPRMVFAGVGLLLRATFVVPGDADPPTYKQAMWRAPDIRKLEAENLSAEATYEEMARDAFRKFTKRYLATLFRDP